MGNRETSTNHRWTLVDAKGRVRGTCTATSKAEAATLFRTGRRYTGAGTPDSPHPTPKGWKILDRGKASLHPDPMPPPTPGSDRRAPTFPLLAADGRIVKFRLEGGVLRPIP